MERKQAAPRRSCQVRAVQASALHDMVFNKVAKVAVVMAGGPAAGKSTILNKFLLSIGRRKEDFVILDSDLILTSMLAFKHLTRRNAQNAVSPSTASWDCFPTATRINIVNLDYAIDNGLNLVFDGTGQDFAWTSDTLMKQRLRSRGYLVYMCIVTVDIETAVERARIRGELEKRFVPAEVVRRIHTNVTANIPLYKGLDFLERLVIYDNTRASPVVTFDSLRPPVVTRGGSRGKVTDLRGSAKRLGIVGYSRMRRSVLEKAVSAAMRRRMV